MAKQMKDFVVRVNVDNWYVKKLGTFKCGSEISGERINSRIIAAIKDKETFISPSGARTAVCVLRGGTIEELEEAFKVPVDKSKASAAKDAVLVATKPEQPKVNEPESDVEEEMDTKPKKPVVDEEEDDEDEDDEDEDDEEEEDKVVEEKKKPVKRATRKPRSNN